MLQQLIDRRLAGKNKSIGNRERFLRRYKDKIGEAVKRAIDGRGIRDLGKGEEIRIPKKDLSEPVFHHGKGGLRDVVHPGNRDHITGDRIARPKGGQGQGSGQASDSGEGEDDFTFALSKEEFMQIFFEDMALPHLVRTQLADIPETKPHRAGFTSDGTPNNMSIVRSMRGAFGRRLAMGGEARREIALLKMRIDELQPHAESAPDAAREIAECELRIVALRAHLERMPFLDPMDLRFRNQVRVPVPSTRAVMFCLMDVSGSMDEQRKDLAKRFFILLYMFLTQHYERIELVFIRHHTQAQEVSEDEFFHAKETGGTVVSSALVLMDQIIKDRYPTHEWNIYGAQASDGDNWDSDSPRCVELLTEHLLPVCRYYAYLQVVDEEKGLWDTYAPLAETSDHFAMRRVQEASDIYPVFRELFKKEGART